MSVSWGQRSGLVVSSDAGIKVADAIRSGDCDLIADLCASGELNISAQLYNGQTPLGMAISLQMTDVVRLLLDLKVDVSVRTSPCQMKQASTAGCKQLYPLELSLSTQNIDLIEMVYDAAPCWRYCSGGIQQLIQSTVKLRAYSLVYRIIKLLEEQEMFQVFSINLAEPLQVAVMQQDMKMVQLLVSLGANVNREHLGSVPLVWAANNQDLRMCLCLLNHGATLTGSISQLGSLQTPLSYAITSGLHKAVSMLLKLGCDPNSVVNWSNNSTRGTLLAGSSMLHYAVIQGNTEIMKLLVEYGATLTSQDSEGNTPLHVACSSYDGNADIIHFLVGDAGIEDCCLRNNGINIQNKKKQTPLIIAAENTRLDLLPLLLDGGADVKVCDSYRMTALHVAVQTGCLHNVLTLLRAGSKVDGLRKRGNRLTPLHLAVRHNDPELVQVLLDHGADINLVTLDGESMLHLAVLAHSETLVKLFLEKGVNVDGRTNTKETALMLASRQDNLDVCRLLMDGGALINLRDKNHETALSLSIYFGFEENARLLIVNGANVNQADNRNTTPMYWAIYNCRIPTMKLLLQAGVKFNLRDLYRYPKNLSVMKDPDVFQWILGYLSGVRSLQEQCRRTIRSKVVVAAQGRGILPNIYKLPLPSKLHRYIAFDSDH